ncbi:uncharacterized protein LOC134530805 isoform X2 [Bacillus rossius redtenbacheri]|uniref:uncharacterized protein LOC134530805 isoform X2 n=1 Tax=Bacillus rossius redtenbacheri TaxID=93214 RepID=UPI002FDDAE19
MAKELWIVFVYDTLRCTEEEDDPQDALLYFHPAWVNDQHRLALCGQLMGTAQFFVSTFSCPRLLALDSGKFLLSRCGRYFLVVGTDRNIPDEVLEHRAVTLLDIIQFYHCDLETMVRSAGTAVKDRLALMLDTYLPMLQYASNLLGVIPSIRLPKSAGNVFLEAMQILQACQEVEGVFGGAVMYENRVVATQFSCGLTKKLVATDPHHIKPVAESVETAFHLPVGVQLLTVYLDRKEFERLSQESASRKLAIENTILKRFIHRKLPPSKMAQTPKEVLSSMKRDTSRIFTVMEEKEGEMEHTEEPNHVQNCVGVDARVLHAKVTSICRAAEQPMLVSPLKSSINGEHSPEKCANGRLEVLVGREEQRARSQSLLDVRHPVRTVPMRCYSLGLPKVTRGMCGEEDDDDDDDDDSPCVARPGKHFFNTITDPLFPVFRSDGLSVSRALFDEYLERHYKLLDLEALPAPPPSEQRTKAQEVYRRSLSLPLKPVTMDEVDDGVDTRRRSYNSDAESPVVRGRPLGSLQLTPLMSRLSLLAEDKTSGFCSRNTTPSEARELADLAVDPARPPPATRKAEEDSQNRDPALGERQGDAGPQKMALYVYGQQDTVLLALLEERSAQDPELVHSLRTRQA